MEWLLSEKIAGGLALLLLIIGLIGDYKASKKPNKPSYPRPDPWDKNFED